MKRPALRAPVVAVLLSIAACGDSDGAAASADGTDGEGSADDSTGADAMSSADDSDESVGEEGESGSTPADVNARGLRISLVEANPGVAVPIARDGAWVQGPERNAQLIKNRNTAFRVYLDVDDAIWVARPIRARMTVTQTDGRESTYEETAEVDGDSSTTSLQSNILLGVIETDIQPGATFQIELFEAGTGYEGLPEAATPPRALDDGPGQIGIESSAQTMRLVMVPVDYSFGGCQASVTLDEAALQPYEDAMFQQNPLESIEIEVREPLVVDDLDLTDSNDFFSLLNRAVQLRGSEAPDPNVYYYVLFDNCGVCIGEGGGCLLGVAPGTPGPTESEASQRVAIGTRYLSGSEVGIETFVHEIGHTQGRQHIACDGATSAGPDPSYPYDGGSIGVWGFGVRDFQIRNPNVHTDYMSYCNPTWVSDWQWRATFERVQALSQWQFDVAPEPTGTILVGTVNTESGESNWWTERGHVEASDTVAAAGDLVLVGAAGDLHSASADIDAWSEGPWVTVRANLPDDAVVAGAEAFELRTAQRVTRVARDQIRFDRTATR
ncbi:MAG: hypothetical protein IAG13_27660 [Deltaproteobacteria bacterium]|nr:hypothetical protein [Nannocystaceae bacterium]